MTTKPIRRVAIIGTGVIGASWTALFLANGLEVVATDVAPNAEAALKRFVEAAWPALKRLGLAPWRITIQTDVHGRPCGGGQGRGPCPGEWARADRLQEEALWTARRAVAARRDHRVELFRPHDERDPIGLRRSPRALRDRASVQSAPFDAAGRDRRRREDLRRDDSARHGILHGLGKRPVRLHKELPGHVANRLQAALSREVYYLVSEGVVSAADADTACSWGPGLRWGIMGSLLLNHLGGGEGGIEHFFQQFTGPMTAWWKVLGQPVLTPEVQKKIIDSVHAEVGSRSIDELAAERDEMLLGLIELRTKVESASAPSNKAVA